MFLEKFTKLNFKDPMLSRLQLGLEKFFAQFVDNPLMKGQVIEAVALDTSETVVTHGLGRTPTGFLVIDIDDAATVHRTGADKFTISLIASAACNVKLWVF